MTDIEAKALALWNEVRAERECAYKQNSINRETDMAEALCRAIERHEAFRQEVSDALLNASGEPLERFIIPKSKPDPLVRIINEVIYAQQQGPINEVTMANNLRAALEARGLKIVENK